MVGSYRTSKEKKILPPSYRHPRSYASRVHKERIKKKQEYEKKQTVFSEYLFSKFRTSTNNKNSSAQYKKLLNKLSDVTNTVKPRMFHTNTKIQFRTIEDIIVFLYLIMLDLIHDIELENFIKKIGKNNGSNKGIFIKFINSLYLSPSLKSSIFSSKIIDTISKQGNILKSPEEFGRNIVKEYFKSVGTNYGFTHKDLGEDEEFKWNQYVTGRPGIIFDQTSKCTVYASEYYNNIVIGLPIIADKGWTITSNLSKSVQTEIAKVIKGTSEERKLLQRFTVQPADSWSADILDHTGERIFETSYKLENEQGIRGGNHFTLSAYITFHDNTRVESSTGCLTASEAKKKPINEALLKTVGDLNLFLYAWENGHYLYTGDRASANMAFFFCCLTEKYNNELLGPLKVNLNNKLLAPDKVNNLKIYGKVPQVLFEIDNSRILIFPNTKQEKRRSISNTLSESLGKFDKKHTYSKTLYTRVVNMKEKVNTRSKNVFLRLLKIVDNELGKNISKEREINLRYAMNRIKKQAMNNFKENKFRSLLNKFKTLPVHIVKRQRNEMNNPQISERNNNNLRETKRKKSGNNNPPPRVAWGPNPQVPSTNSNRGNLQYQKRPRITPLTQQ